MRILVVGSGGREHALAWSLTRSPLVDRVYVTPGNAGTEWSDHTANDGCRMADSVNVQIKANDIPALIQFARQNQIDLTVVGPEVPLAAGIVDDFQAAGLCIFGPSKAAAQLEASKVFAKEFMRDHGIPTADFAVFNDYDAACHYVDDQTRPLVIKADGLAAGKGVIVCNTPDEAKDALRLMLVDRPFGEAGERVIIENRLDGSEVSVLAFVDGQHFALMPYAADHKRAYDGDQGPNTGGMGAYASRIIDYPNFEKIVIEEVIRPTIDGMTKRGTPYKGVLYAGVMITPDGPQVLEYNCRFGDPETQVILPLLETDLVDILNVCIDGTLDQLNIKWREEFCAAVVLASGGYPGDYQTGLPIRIDWPLPAGSMLFHAGTKREGNEYVTSGGRVMAVTALGSTLQQALDRAYAAVEHIHFDGMHYRKDIGRTVRESVK